MESVFSVLLSVIYSFSFVLCSSSWRVFRLRGALPLWRYEGCLWKLIFTNHTRTSTGKFDIIVSIWTCTYDNWKIIFFLNSHSRHVVEMFDYKLNNSINRRKLRSRLFAIKIDFWMPLLVFFTTFRKKLPMKKNQKTNTKRWQHVSTTLPNVGHAFLTGYKIWNNLLSHSYTWIHCAVVVISGFFGA